LATVAADRTFIIKVRPTVVRKLVNLDTARDWPNRKAITVKPINAGIVFKHQVEMRFGNPVMS
jgi:hypothetical protein